MCKQMLSVFISSYFSLKSENLFPYALCQIKICINLSLPTTFCVCLHCCRRRCMRYCIYLLQSPVAHIIEYSVSKFSFELRAFLKHFSLKGNFYKTTGFERTWPHVSQIKCCCSDTVSVGNSLGLGQSGCLLPAGFLSIIESLLSSSQAFCVVPEKKNIKPIKDEFTEMQLALFGTSSNMEILLQN